MIDAWLDRAMKALSVVLFGFLFVWISMIVIAALWAAADFIVQR